MWKVAKPGIMYEAFILKKLPLKLYLHCLKSYVLNRLINELFIKKLLLLGIILP